MFGGTFDPVHDGHLQTVSAVQQRLGLAKVLFIPAARPRLRALPQASVAHRLTMLKRALIDRPFFEVNEMEISREGPSTTIPTLEVLHQTYPTTPICLILGIDAFLKIPKWHRWTDLLELAHLVVMSRPGVVLQTEQPTWWTPAVTTDLELVHQSSAGSIVMLEVPAMDIAASDIRERLRLGDDVSSCMPVAVFEYIRAHQLYGFDS